MENQHRLIKGYRELSQEEIDLMNRIKIAEAQTLELVAEVRQHAVKQMVHSNDDEAKRIADANPVRWQAIATSHIEQGFMALVRAVAQPMPPRLEKDN